MRRTGLAVALAALAWTGSSRPGRAETARAQAEARADWKSEFDDVCAKTQDAMALSTEELRSLVDRCDRLRPAIEALDESERKVYSRRLKACRDLYAYVLESRQQAEAP